jgi:hypothetical protein
MDCGESTPLSLLLPRIQPTQRLRPRTTKLKIAKTRSPAPTPHHQPLTPVAYPLHPRCAGVVLRVPTDTPPTPPSDTPSNPVNHVNPVKNLHPVEPEKIPTLPEDQPLKPENEPEKNLKIQVRSFASRSFDASSLQRHTNWGDNLNIWLGKASKVFIFVIVIS